jgi:5-methylcytosine-specific restriction protein A
VPSYPCAWPTCSHYVDRRGRRCAEHSTREFDPKGSVAALSAYNYNKFVRDPEHVRFYNSAAWERARSTKLANDPVCERCRRVFAQHVHHKIPLERCTIEQRTAQSILESLCIPCHNKEKSKR